jgi:hypothetical protein
VVECLPNKYKALNSNPSTTQKKKKKESKSEKKDYTPVISAIWRMRQDQEFQASWAPGLTPIILVTQKAEIRRIMI